MLAPATHAEGVGVKIAVVGATGLLGHHSARAIRVAGHELVLVHRPSSPIERLAYLQGECRTAELLDHDALTRALQGIDGVIFSAGYYPTRPRPWQDDVATALNLSNHFYAACQAAGVPASCTLARRSPCLAIRRARRGTKGFSMRACRAGATPIC